MLKGSAEPIDLFTFDGITNMISVEEEAPDVTYHEEKKRRARQRLARDRYKQQIFSGEIQASGLFETDIDLIEMTRYYDKRFLKRYEVAVNLYIEGYWPEAKAILQEIERIKGMEDAPTQQLLKFMKKYNYIVPDEWQSHRVFSAK